MTRTPPQLLARIDWALAPIVVVRAGERDFLELQSVVRALGIGWKRAELAMAVGLHQLRNARARGTDAPWPALCVPVNLAGTALGDVIAPLAAAHSALASRRMGRLPGDLAAEFRRLAVQPTSPAPTGRIRPEAAAAFFAHMRDGRSVLGACKLAGLNNRFGHELLKTDWGLNDPRIAIRAIQGRSAGCGQPTEA